MIPDPRFAWTDEVELRAFAARTAFATIAVAVEERVLTAHAPLAFGVDGAPCVHLARGNPLVRHLDGRPVLATIVGTHGYVSPDWYGTEDQVPTWNYRLVEIEGIARRLDEPGLIDQLDRVSAAQEALLLPKAPWTRAKMTPARFAAMTRAIDGFAIEGATFRGVAKLGQNKTDAEAAGAVAGLRGAGHPALAQDMEDAR